MYSSEHTISGTDKEAGPSDFSQPEKDYSKMARMGFIRKVYGILAAQLVLTFGLVCLVFIPSFSSFLIHIPNAFVLFYVAMGISFATIILLACCKSISRSVPINYILLFIFTSCEAYMLMHCCAIYEKSIVISAAALTAAVTVSLTIYAFTTKTDFTWCGGLLFAGVCILIVTGLLGCCFGFNKITYILYCSGGVFVYSIYLIYDTQLISGKFGNDFEIDDYVLAAVNVYLDIVNLFLYILSLLGNH